MNTHDTMSFIPEGGDSGRQLRGIDWSRHPLGPPSGWSSCFRTTLGIVYGARHPVLLWWSKDLYQFHNDAYVPAIGADKQHQALGQRAEDCWAEAWAIIGPQIEEVWRTKQACHHTDFLVPVVRDGQLREAWWTYGYSPVIEQDGSVVGILCVCNETTQQILATRALHASQDLLQRSQTEAQAAKQELHDFMMQAPIGFCILSGPRHVYTLINSAYLQMCHDGRAATEFMGKEVRDVLPELAGQGYFEMLDEVYRTGVTAQGNNVKANTRHNDGKIKEIYINFVCQAKRSADQRIDGILAIVYDVTNQVREQRKIELLAENLRSAVVSRDTFLGIASHELNTPLTTLKLQLQIHTRWLAKDDVRAYAKEKIKTLVDRAELQVGRLQRLVEDMLDVSRLATGRLTLVKKPVDLSRLTEDTFERHRPQLDAAGCTSSCATEPSLWVQADAARIEQVLSNLLTNAAKYAPRCRLQVGAGAGAEGCVRVWVQDAGPGIAPEHQQRIFGRFERAIAANEASGLGLGLYICKQIIADHGGSVGLSSQVGAGSTFYFELPSLGPRGL